MIGRQTAIPCTLKELTEGSFVQNPGLEPSGVKTDRGMISRASIMGVIIDKGQSTITLEDGTTALSVRTFDQKPIFADVGDLVLVIGRPREYNGERYIVLEICKRLKSKAWIEYRRRELQYLEPATVEVKVEKPVKQEINAGPVEAPVQKNPFEMIIQRIRETDKGQGADIEEVLASIPDGNKFLQTLIEEGEIFEIRPGKLKVLE